MESSIILNHAVMIEGKLVHKGAKITVIEEDVDFTGSETGNYENDVDNGVYPVKRVGGEDDIDMSLFFAKKAEDEEDEVSELKRVGGEDDIDMSLFPM